MPKKIKMLSILLLGISFSNISQGNIHQENTTTDLITHTDFYKHIVISHVDSKKNDHFINSKILINDITYKSESPIKGTILTGTKTPTLGKLLWTITADNLPVTEDQCNEETMDLCKYLSWDNSCFKPCLTYGPEIMSFDEKANKLYFAVSSTAVGSTGAGPYFTFIANLNKKEVRHLTLKTIDRPVNSSLSHSGRYLLTYGYNYLTIIDTKTSDIIDLSVDNSKQHGAEQLHYLGKIKWLNETQFSYNDGIRHSTSQDSFDDMKENIYDIAIKKMIRSRTLMKTEYDSSVYAES